jgi:hypothetical protein
MNQSEGIEDYYYPIDFLYNTGHFGNNTMAFFGKLFARVVG